MIGAESDALARLLEPHLQVARDRDPLINMLTSSPPDSPLSSSDDELQWEDKGSRGAPAGFAKRATVAMRPARQEPTAAGNAERDRKRRVLFAEGDDDYEFEYEAVVAPAVVESGGSESAPVSLLAGLLGGGNAAGSSSGGARPGGTSGRGTAAAAADAGPPVRIRIFGAGVVSATIEGPMQIEVTRSTTFAQAIARVLQRASGREGVGAQAYAAAQAAAYELLMADDEGEADDDFPPPPPDNRIADFGTDFRLRSAKPAVVERALAEAEKAAAAAEASAAAGPPGERVMRVHLPREAFGQRLQQWVITLPFKEELLLADMMGEVCRKRGVRLHPEKHVFTLPNSDVPLNMGARLGDIELPKSGVGVPEIAVAPRAYADAPPRLKRGEAGPGGRSPGHVGSVAPSVKEEAGTGAAGGAVDAKDDPSRVFEFVFSDVTAAQYKEYHVIKVNKRGVRQERIIGIDRERFYNLAHSREGDLGPSSFRDWGLKTIGLRQVDGGTKHPFRPMRDALDARVVEGEPRTIEVIFKDVSDNQGAGVKARKTQRYEAQSPRDAAEIVAKLEYLMHLQGGARTQRLADDDLGPPQTPIGGRQGLGAGFLTNRPERRLSAGGW